ncbi:hypothetical protein BHE19_10090 [Flavobacterium tructae]|uniref:Uncharacterized protein n=1 Tax=Flavobacterium tructae TaxID=1114873 RepID=A0A1S1J6C8_9FLAO|nr:hypothetical protein BHE19_10090 [Flavobacterium tructae]
MFKRISVALKRSVFPTAKGESKALCTLEGDFRNFTTTGAQTTTIFIVMVFFGTCWATDKYFGFKGMKRG